MAGPNYSPTRSEAASIERSARLEFVQSHQGNIPAIRKNYIVAINLTPNAGTYLRMSLRKVAVSLNYINEKC